MQKMSLFIATLALAASIGLAAPVGVFAQYTSYYNYNPYGAYIPSVSGTTYTYGSVGSGCTDLTNNLFLNVRDVTTGGQVSALQSFLISNGYLTITRIPTGQFGVATNAAVKNYQYGHGLPVTGYVDVATRLAIRNQTCGSTYGNSYGTNYGYTDNNYGYQNYNNNYTNGYYNYDNGYYNNYNNYNYVVSAPILKSLSTYSGSAGTSVTIYGVAFDYNNNTVNFWGTVISGLSSSNNTSLTFTVPQIYNSSYTNYYNNNSGTYPITVTTAYGTSNTLNFTLTGNNSGYCNTYNGNCYTNGQQPALSYLSPNSGRVGTQIVISGSGFTPTGNVVHFGTGGTMNLSSNNGTSIYYTIPSYVSGCDITTSNTYCPMYAQQITPGTYSVYVSNNYGQTSTLYFTVTY